jgi:hypothetical protein
MLYGNRNKNKKIKKIKNKIERVMVIKIKLYLLSIRG